MLSVLFLGAADEDGRVSGVIVGDATREPRKPSGHQSADRESSEGDAEQPQVRRGGESTSCTHLYT